ncbi:hypothetical protein E4U60_000870 [Claviceps pazoutovae]|uniref:4'-phosphopantetheinyl transferase domain-containing protein n=1 Tax=Claviceps pazoutovae TaxID=1649127 RepID=A0A9P7MK96_9HYPO|nr:hypothetical protein E4U60_000870 [Claviceps pazoutovae]
MPPPLRPFPFPIHVGTDICQISRIYAILNSPRRRRFIHRVLAPEEVAQHGTRLGEDIPGEAAKSDRDGTRTGNEKGDVKGSALWKTAAFLAGRFAAKEAVIKAHPYRRLTLHDVVVERMPGRHEDRLGSGPPVARIKAGNGDARGADGEGDVSALISISHDGDYATAFCVAHHPSRSMD